MALPGKAGFGNGSLKGRRLPEAFRRAFCLGVALCTSASFMAVDGEMWKRRARSEGEGMHDERALEEDAGGHVGEP